MKDQNREDYKESLKLLERYKINRVLIDTYRDHKRQLEEYKRIAEGKTLTAVKNAEEYANRQEEQRKEDNKKIAALINLVSDPTAKQVIIYRAAYKMTWHQIAEKTNYCEQSIYRYFYKGLENLEEILKKG